MQVFISYAHQDTEQAGRLAEDLSKLGLRVWIATESLRASDSWVSSISKALDQSTHLVVLLTPASVQSPWVEKEMEVAINLEREKRLRIIPLLFAKCRVPPFWASYQGIDFVDDYDAGLQALVAALRGRQARAMPKVKLLAALGKGAPVIRVQPLTPRRKSSPLDQLLTPDREKRLEEMLKEPLFGKRKDD